MTLTYCKEKRATSENVGRSMKGRIEYTGDNLRLVGWRLSIEIEQTKRRRTLILSQ